VLNTHKLDMTTIKNNTINLNKRTGELIIYAQTETNKAKA